MFDVIDLIFNSGFIFVLVIAAVAVFLNFVPLGLWISAIAAGVNVGIFNLIGMRLRRVPASKIVLPLIKANKALMLMLINWRLIIWQAVMWTELLMLLLLLTERRFL